MIDILSGRTLVLPCLDKGFVRLVDCLPRIVPDDQNAEFRIVQAARISYGDGTKSVNEDVGLIRYLLRHRHTTPLEKVKFEFHIKLPLFVNQQWLRHRTANINQISARYSVMKDEFYIPAEDDVRRQSTKNKQVSEGQVEMDISQDFRDGLIQDCQHLYDKYQRDLDVGIGREQARIRLPANLYTELYWTMDLHNLLHFLALRCDSHAQKEIQVYANAILELIKPIVPNVIQAWEDYHPMRQAMLLTRLELEAMKLSMHAGTIIGIKSDNKREQEEWAHKAQLIFGRS